MKSVALFVVAAAAGAVPEAQDPPLRRFEYSQTEMAVRVRIVLYAAGQGTADEASAAAFRRIGQLNDVLSDYDPQSELRQLCSTAGQGRAVPVSEDLWRVLCGARQVSDQSAGAFDVTVGPVVRLWRRARRRGVLPDADRLQAARALVDYRRVRLDESRRAVQLDKPGMRLDLGGIAKGFAVDAALRVLADRGLTKALVDAGGDVGLGGPPPGRSGWRVGVAPQDPEGTPTQVLLLAGRAIATSGDTWQYVEIGGRRYSHIVDPRTGLGLTDRSTVSVVADDGMTADALASAVSVLGPEQGLKLIEAMPGCEALIVRAGQNGTTTFSSSGWKDLPR